MPIPKWNEPNPHAMHDFGVWADQQWKTRWKKSNTYHQLATYTYSKDPIEEAIIEAMDIVFHLWMAQRKIRQLEQ